MSRFRSGCCRCLEIVRPDTVTALAPASVPLFGPGTGGAERGKPIVTAQIRDSIRRINQGPLIARRPRGTAQVQDRGRGSLARAPWQNPCVERLLEAGWLASGMGPSLCRSCGLRHVLYV